MKREAMMNTRTCCNPWETIYASGPQQMPDRREAVVPLLRIMQGARDDDVSPAVRGKFAAPY